jgi:hypothetical protein
MEKFKKTLLLPNLEYLSFNSTTVNIGFIYYILSGIQRAVSQNNGKNIQHLDYLDLSSTNLTINEGPYIDNLFTSTPERTVIEYTDITRENFYSIFNTIASNLKILKLSNSQLADPQLFYNMLNGADELIKLIFKQNSKPDLKTSNLKFDKPFTNLKVIDFTNIPIDTSAETLNSNPEFEFDITQYTVHIILTKSPNLEELYLSSNNLSKFKETNLERGLELTDLNNLKILRLDNTNIAEEYLNYLLEHTPNLQVLGLNSDVLIWKIEDCAVHITNLKLTELYINIIGLTGDDLRKITEQIIRPIETLNTLELPYIESYDYGNLAFRPYKKVVLYDNNTIADILKPSTDPPAKKKEKLDAAVGDITNQLNNMYNENMGITGGSGSGDSSNTMMIIIIVFVILLITGVGGFLLFKYL